MPKDTPFILVACKTDLRYDDATIEKLRKCGQAPVGMQEGIVLAHKAGAHAYIETSSVHNVRVALDRRGYPTNSILA